MQRMLCTSVNSLFLPKRQSTLHQNSIHIKVALEGGKKKEIAAICDSKTLVMLSIFDLLLGILIVHTTAAVPLLPRGATRTTDLYGPGYLASRTDEDTIPSNCPELCNCSGLTEYA